MQTQKMEEAAEPEAVLPEEREQLEPEEAATVVGAALHQRVEPEVQEQQEPRVKLEK
jgi:hypothetical protein